MRGKPIDQVTVNDLNQLISDGVAKGRLLEFKFDVPVSPEEQKRQRSKAPDTTPVDRSWLNGRSIQDYGRDALVEEIVAFANADGGTLILGMDETAEAPPRAIRINALPDVAGLERRLRDILLSCVEPRLPYVAVRGLPTNDDGSGVIVIETSSSRLGPHWVAKTRKPTIRREDRCVPLSMPEVHDMVLRNASGLSVIRDHIKNVRSKFYENFEEYLYRKVPYATIQRRGAADDWLLQNKLAALAAQVIISPHYDLGIPRLENLQNLMPSENTFSVFSSDSSDAIPYCSSYSFAEEGCQKILGGIIATQTGGFNKTVRVLRSGQVTVDFMQVREIEKCTCYADLIADLVGFAIGVYDRMRQKSSHPMAPADVVVDIHTRQNVGVGSYQGFGFKSSYGKLDEYVPFPIYTFGDVSDIDVVLSEIASDLMNAAGMPASFLPKVIWTGGVHD